MAPLSQELEPPAIPGRFILLIMASLSQELEPPAIPERFCFIVDFVQHLLNDLVIDLYHLLFWV